MRCTDHIDRVVKASMKQFLSSNSGGDAKCLPQSMDDDFLSTEPAWVRVPLMCFDGQVYVEDAAEI